MARKYPYAVMDGNQAPDQYRFAESCHLSLDSAKRAARRENSADPNAHYYVIAWDAPRWARERPAPKHEVGL